MQTKRAHIFVILGFLFKKVDLASQNTRVAHLFTFDVRMRYKPDANVTFSGVKLD